MFCWCIKGMACGWFKFMMGCCLVSVVSWCIKAFVAWRFFACLVLCLSAPPPVLAWAGAASKHGLTGACTSMPVTRSNAAFGLAHDAPFTRASCTYWRGALGSWGAPVKHAHSSQTDTFWVLGAAEGKRPDLTPTLRTCALRHCHPCLHCCTRARADTISELKLGNGTSVLIFANIASALPSSVGLLTVALSCARAPAVRCHSPKDGLRPGWACLPLRPPLLLSFRQAVSPKGHMPTIGHAAGPLLQGPRPHAARHTGHESGCAGGAGQQGGGCRVHTALDDL